MLILTRIGWNLLHIQSQKSRGSIKTMDRIIWSHWSHTTTKKNFFSFSSGMVSCCRFLGENQMITSSGDCSCMLWDVESAGISQKFADHTSDVTALAINPGNQNVFVSVSGDNTAKLWDIRSGKVLFTFKGHTAEINCIE